MERYYRFDAHAFLKESKGWAKEKKKLERELESIPELKAMENSEVHSGSTSDPTAQVSLKRVHLMEEIRRINIYENALRYAWDNLTEEEQDILARFYFTRKRINYEVHLLCDKYHIEKSQVYNRKNKALKELTDLVEDYIN